MTAVTKTTTDQNATGRVEAPTPLIAIGGVILSMALVAVGNGLMFAYIPVRLGAEGFPPALAGTIITGLSAGGLAGCILTGPLVKRVGHARAFMVLSALIALSNAAVGAGPHPVLWIAARSLYGLAICGLFVVAQSWLNDAVANAIRGRVMAVFYVAYIAGLGVGYYLLAFVDLRSAEAPLIGIAFTALSILPVGMTRLRQPSPPQGASLALRRAWRVSPVGVAGMLAVGGLSMVIVGFAPIHATAKGYSQQEVAMLLSAMPLGTLILQIPLGWVSDRTDRRYVLIAASLLVVLAGLFAAGFDGGALATLVIIYIVWDGAAEFDLFAGQRPCQRPSRQAGPRCPVEFDAFCLVFLRFRRYRHRDNADGPVRHAGLHVCGNRDRRCLCSLRRLACGEGGTCSGR